MIYFRYILFQIQPQKPQGVFCSETEVGKRGVNTKIIYCDKITIGIGIM